MPKPKTDLRLLVEDYCAKYTNWKDYTLSKKIYEENTDKFKSIEHIRKSYVLIVRGHGGKIHRPQATQAKPLTYNTTNWKPFKEEINTTAKVLILDIETAPIRAYVWGIWNQNISPNQIESDWFCLTWAAKWLFEDKVYSGKLTPKEVKSQNDGRIIKGVWRLLNEADVVIAHNAEKFDIPKLNSRFVLNMMHPPLPYQVIDTLKHIRRQFGFTSNKLDYVNKLLNLERKQDTGGFELWEKCINGDGEALAKMESYNVTDVKILEETYLRMRAWIKPHPNIGLFILDAHERCPSCGSNELNEEGKEYVTSANKFVVFRCGNCGSTGRRRKSTLTVTEKRNNLISVAK